MSDRLKLADVIAADLPDWRMINNALYTAYETGGFAYGLELLEQIGEAAEAADHHPDVILTYPRLEVKLSSHDVGGVTDRDLTLARIISDLALTAGHVADTGHTVVEYGLDTHDGSRLARFWAAVLDADLEDEDGEESVATGPYAPGVWFQQSAPLPEPPAQRWHPDVWVPHDGAEERIKAALDAGGKLVDDTHAPSFWVLADPDGNKVCICTDLER
ncbi:4a-hydroxytetrahydrobiopterin dehydratase [Raineyella antarctica]|uniref:Putative pterin-4-alpha-carbinolamine dehydratase n=1 Tax=Raineyella antarctica TaxID=1577474 RepID=A0A1G6I6B5_9ACTN|nr:VOC family protein [Raineyella antarctica]SDC02077.1 4a-hydroxytetrahydrobiopterin dehydratase [Raineyella antarctica]